MSTPAKVRWRSGRTPISSSGIPTPPRRLRRNPRSVASITTCSRDSPAGACRGRRLRAAGSRGSTGISGPKPEPGIMWRALRFRPLTWRTRHGANSPHRNGCNATTLPRDDRGIAEDTMQNLKINAQRLWDTLMETAKFGRTMKGGINRLTLTDDDKKVRDWFRHAAEAAGCTVAIDEVGNMFARRPGRREGLAPLAMGSHLDTQPTGGKFDGVLGVLAALEAVRTLQESGYETNAPIEIVNWTNEEGSRFAPAMLGSGVFAGAFPVDYANACQDRDGNTFADALSRIGYRGSEKAGAHKLGAMFELHIEQGPILENAGATIGVVTGVQGMRWYDVTVCGE